MKTENVLLFLAAIAVVVSVIGASVTYSSQLNNKESWITGFVTDVATVNLSVITSADINFTIDSINFSSGRVFSGASSATLITSNPALNNTNGTWRNVTQGWVLQNIGNVNVTLYLMSGKTAATFLGGSGPSYQYNVSPINVSGGVVPGNWTCTNVSSNQFYTWINVNNTLAGTSGNYHCSNFSYVDGNDTLRIDLRLVIPSDSLTGNLGDIFTATAEQSA